MYLQDQESTRAGDDDAGLSVSSRMKSDNVSLKVAMRNTNDGISLIQTTEGSLNEVYNILTRMRELAVQGANDTYSSTDRGQIQIEFNQLRAEISRISTDANFNRIGVLSSTKTLKFQIGINNASNNQFDIDNRYNVVLLWVLWILQVQKYLLVQLVHLPLLVQRSPQLIQHCLL